MPINEVAILLGCHGFDDFPVHHEGDDAQSLLSAWTALWHPRLIAAHGKIPLLHQVDAPPEDRSGKLWVVPSPFADQLHPQVAHDVESQGGLLVRSATTRDAILQPALTILNADANDRPPLSDDFFALGYAYLQVELLTHQMRYSTGSEQAGFEDNLAGAARSALEGNEQATRDQLQSCFDLLSQERDHYYAVDVFLVDLTMLAPSLLGQPLLDELARPAKTNLMMTAAMLATMETEAPQSLQALKASIEDGKADVIGGEYSELPLSLVATETIRSQLKTGTECFQNHLGRRPTVYGRRSFGLGPCLPQMLSKFGFRGAVHATFDGGQFPQATQSKSRWEGDAQASVDAIVRVPLDASQAATFLNLASSVSESMDMDHVATRCFAHWAGTVSPWYQELQRVTQYTSALGRFVTLDEYFEETYDPGMHERFQADQYRSPRLQACVSRDDPHPISASISYWRRYLLLQSLWSCRAMHVVVHDQPGTRESYQQAVAACERFTQTAFDETAGDDWLEIEDALQQCAGALAAAVNTASSDNTVDGLAVVQPLGFPRRVALLDAALSNLPQVKPPVYAAFESKQKQFMVDAPGWSITFVGAATDARPSTGRRRATPSLAEELTLHNEFLEAKIDESTGALRTLKDYSARGNRLSQQLAFRNGRSGEAAELYTRMEADSVQVTAADSAVGEIVSKGRLVNSGGHSVANFEQTYRLLRGSRVLVIEIGLDPQRDPESDAWNSYYGCRFAWSSEAAELATALNDVRRPTTAKRFEAPLFIQVDDGDQRTAILTGGLPYHRRTGLRMLDSLLMVRGETQREFRIGIGLDLKQPFREAQSLLAPEIVVPNLRVGAENGSNWLFHINAPHVLMTSWEPILDETRITGVRMRLCEVDGRPGQVCIRSFRPLQSARKTDFLGQTATECEIGEKQLSFQISAHEQTEIEAIFAV